MSRGCGATKDKTGARSKQCAWCGAVFDRGNRLSQKQWKQAKQPPKQLEDIDGERTRNFTYQGARKWQTI